MRQRAKNSSPAREVWYRIHSLQRKNRREAMKAYADLVVTGTGFMRVDHATGEARHIPYAEVINTGESAQ